MNKKQLISAIRKAIREKKLTTACKLIPGKNFNEKNEWVHKNISFSRAHFLQRTYDNFWRNKEKWLYNFNFAYFTHAKYYDLEWIQKSNALHMIKRLIKEEITPYTKIAMYGHTHLYFCSPIYKHKDYNKIQCCKIEGNEKLCEKIIELSNKIYNKKKGETK